MGKQEWTTKDVALLGACQVLSALQHERAPRPVSPTPRNLAPQLDRDELFLAWGHFGLLEFTAPGDGSYQHNSGFVIGRPALMGAFAIGQAIGNSRRRGRAYADAQPRWMQIDAGNVIVSTHGFYLDTPHGMLTWNWGSVQQGEMVAPSEFMLAGTSQDGPVRYVLNSDWAELAFVLWARSQHPRHQQLAGAGWLPQGWPAFARGMGQELPPLLS